MLYVQRLAYDNNVKITFLPDKCVIQDLVTNWTLGVGHAVEKLHILNGDSFTVSLCKGKTIGCIFNNVDHGHQKECNSDCKQMNDSNELWHCRMGHPSVDVFDHLVIKKLNKMLLRHVKFVTKLNNSEPHF